MRQPEIRFFEPTSHWWLALSEATVRSLLATAVRQASLPDYLGVTVEIAGRTLLDTGQGKPVLATVSVPAADSAAPGMGARVRRAHPAGDRVRLKLKRRREREGNSDRCRWPPTGRV